MVFFKNKSNICMNGFKRLWKDVHKNENSNYLQGMGLWMGLIFFL